MRGNLGKDETKPPRATMAATSAPSPNLLACPSAQQQPVSVRTRDWLTVGVYILVGRFPREEENAPYEVINRIAPSRLRRRRLKRLPCHASADAAHYAT